MSNEDLPIKEIEKLPIDDLITYLDRDSCPDESYVAAKRMLELVNALRICIAQITTQSENENVYDDANGKDISVAKIQAMLKKPITRWELKEILQGATCEVCSGLGVCDDNDGGGITFNTWACTDCKGTGLKEGINPFAV